MTKTLIRVELSSEGESPKQIIERMRRIGAIPVIGEYDFELDIADDQRLFERLEEVHVALRGSGVRYTVTTRPSTHGPATAAELLASPEVRRRVYEAKLQRWRSMGLDVSPLETVLARDPEAFREASRAFLRANLGRLGVVRDTEAQLDERATKVHEAIAERGSTLSRLLKATELAEAELLTALARLISAGRIRRVKRGATELYVREESGHFQRKLREEEAGRAEPSGPGAASGPEG